MRTPLFPLGFLTLAIAASAFAAPRDPNVAAYDEILDVVAPGQTTIALGDMIVPVETVRLWRDKLANTSQNGAQSASQSGINKWPGGNVYYAFNANVSAAHQAAFLDGVREWETFANVHFIARTSQTGYVMVNDGCASLSGGNSAVGMAPLAQQPQQLNIGTTSWNRPTIVHESGHALGLIHEHQRSDRDIYVTINFSNVPGGATDGNFILIPTSTNNGAYDFLSVMHYGRKGLAVNPAIDTITPKAAYAQYLDIMGGFGDRVLSRGDRDGMSLAAMYGAGPAVSTVVTNTKDSGVGALRTAIYKAFDIVTDTPATTPTIAFNIPNTDPNFAGGVFTITPRDRLPAPGPHVTIDGTTQTAFTGDTNANGPEIVLNGTIQSAEASTYGLGLQLIDAGITVKGFVIQGFNTRGILITGVGATGCNVAGCYIGTNAAGTAAVANSFSGIEISGGATGNTIGGTTVAARNVISGNLAQGIFMNGTGTGGNVIAGNYIGTNATGVAALANGVGSHFAGVEINGGTGANIVGGTAAGAGNVLSGNTGQGVAIIGSQSNTVAGNFVGTNAAGTAAVPNTYAGVQIFGVGQFNVIGGSTAAARNILSGNLSQGAAISGAGTSNNGIVGNYAGLNAAGTAAIPNTYAGVEIFGGATYNVIGGAAAGTGNVLSGNLGQGVAISNAGSNNNTIAGNFIGTNPAGMAAIGNGTTSARYSGIGLFSGASANTIGGTTPGAGNLISGNTGQGILFYDTGTNSNVVAGNFIGLNAAGTAAVANGWSGIEIAGSAQGNKIGGNTVAARNVISGNSLQGVAINGAGTSSNIIAGNYIGTNPAGAGALGNGWLGVEIYSAASANTIGGTAPGAGNMISGNGVRGVTVTDLGTNNNVFTGNLIGLNAAGTAALPNAGPGIQIFGGAQGNTIGSTSGGRNFISGNNGAGITISGSPTNNNTVVGNSIGTTPAGTAVANANEGIALFADGSGGAQGNTIGGAAPGAANFISGNTGPGVGIYNAGTINNRISGNSIVGNGGRGIDLLSDGVTANDAGDADTGPNNLQNFPILTAAVLGTSITVTGTLNSTANTTFRIEFFENTTGDSSGNGEGQNFIGATNVTTNASGNATISTALAAIVPAGHVISATATDPSGNTSEFSANRTVITTDSDSDGLPDAYELANWPALTTTTGATDSDGDGMTNAQEFRAGTDPRNPGSVFRLAPPTAVGADETLSLPNVAGRTYRIDYADDLLPANHWRILADQIPGTGSTIVITDPGAASLPKRFYRAVVVP